MAWRNVGGQKRIYVGISYAFEIFWEPRTGEISNKVICELFVINHCSLPFSNVSLPFPKALSEKKQSNNFETVFYKGSIKG